MTVSITYSWHFFQNFQGPDWRFGSSFFPGTAHKPQKGFSSTWITHLPSVSINLMVSVRGFTFAKCFFSCGVVWCGFNWPRLNWQKGGVTPCHPKLSCCCVWWLVKCQHVLPPWLNIGPGSLRCSPYENEVFRVKDFMPCSSDQVLRSFIRLLRASKMHCNGSLLEFWILKDASSEGVKGCERSINFMPFGRIFRV